jgi:hypothetical protein
VAARKMGNYIGLPLQSGCDFASLCAAVAAGGLPLQVLLFFQVKILDELHVLFDLGLEILV